jgi:hypothetical protein
MRDNESLPNVTIVLNVNTILEGRRYILVAIKCFISTVDVGVKHDCNTANSANCIV